MPGRALSQQVIKKKQRRIIDTNLAAAVDAYEQEQVKATSPTAGTPKGLREVARDFGISKSTLQRHVNGEESISGFNATKRHLAPVEERAVVDHIMERADRAIPPTHDEIRDLVNTILATPGRYPEGTTPITIGHNWVDRFLARHHDELQTHWSRPLDTVRAKSLNTGTVQHWYYDIVEERFVKGGFLPENTYAMDESGFPRGPAHRQRVVGRRGTKVQHLQGTANRENVTVLVTICADGTKLKPTIVFKASDCQPEWRDNNISGASFAWSETGWTNGEIAASWLIDDFDVQTRDKAAGKPRALFVDGHSSHYTQALLDAARERNITIFGYPPHCTHALQGLDVACFGCMKQIFAEEVKQFEAEHGRGVDKEDFAYVFGKAYLRAFTVETILSAWEKTGLVPFNPDVITEEQMKPAQTTSTHESFTLEQPSPVRAIIKALYDNPPTAQELDTDTFVPFTTPREPVTPTRTRVQKRPHPTESDDIESPTSRRRLLVSGLAQTRSGAILVNADPITSDTPILEPILAPVSPIRPRRRTVPAEAPTTLSSALKIIEMQRGTMEDQAQSLETKSSLIRSLNAQIIIQDLQLGKLNKALKGKETRKQRKRTKFFPEGKGRVLTDDAFRDLVKDIEDRKTREEEEKKLRQARRGEAKTRKAGIEAEWKQLLTEHNASVAAWEVQCQQLLAQGTLKKNLPKKPKRPVKPKASSAAGPSSLSRGEDEEEGEEEMSAGSSSESGEDE